jgi:hypothetical protein
MKRSWGAKWHLFGMSESQKCGIIVGFLDRVTGGLIENEKKENYSTPRIVFVNLIFKGWLVNVETMIDYSVHRVPLYPTVTHN